MNLVEFFNLPNEYLLHKLFDCLYLEFDIADLVEKPFPKVFNRWCFQLSPYVFVEKLHPCLPCRFGECFDSYVNLVWFYLKQQVNEHCS